MSWLSLRVLPDHDRDAVAEVLFASGAQGVHEDGASLVTHFPPETNIDRIADLVRGADPGAEVTIGRAADTDWSEAWKALLAVQEVGALRIAPPWLASDFDPATTIVIDPGMAFGTGDHPTTRGVVRLIQRVPLRGLRVADLGAGSGVLSIAAAKLGARRVTAVELDSDAIGNALENVARNDVEGVVQVIEGDAALILPLLAPVDLILANIVSSVHVELLPILATSLSDGGWAILSGILTDERGMLTTHLDRGGWAVTDDDVEDIWWSATISRR